MRGGAISLLAAWSWIGFCDNAGRPMEQSSPQQNSVGWGAAIGKSERPLAAENPLLRPMPEDGMLHTPALSIVNKTNGPRWQGVVLVPLQQ